MSPKSRQIVWSGSRPMVETPAPTVNDAPRPGPSTTTSQPAGNCPAAEDAAVGAEKTSGAISAA